MSSYKAGVNGSMNAPKSTNSKPRKNYMNKENVGLADGINAQMTFDSETTGPKADYDRDSLTGNATERPMKYKGPKVTSKGIDFDIC